MKWMMKDYKSFGSIHLCNQTHRFKPKLKAAISFFACMSTVPLDFIILNRKSVLYFSTYKITTRGPIHEANIQQFSS